MLIRLNDNDDNNDGDFILVLNSLDFTASQLGSVRSFPSACAVRSMKITANFKHLQNKK